MKKLILATVLVPAAAHADVEIGAVLGAHAFSHTTELGARDASSDPGPESSGLLGARFAYVLGRRLAIEGEASLIPTRDDVLGDPVTVIGLGAHIRFDLLTGRLRPFVVAGGGAHVLRSSTPQMSSDVDQAWHWGGGVRWALTRTVDVRLDVRHLIVPDRTMNGATSDFEVTAGISYRFGKKPPKPVVAVAAEPPPPPPPPPAPEPEPEPAPEPPPKPAPIEELAGIHFELDSATISVDSAPILERAYELLVAHPDRSVEIAGYTSSEGDPARNLALSLQRAEAVKAYLVARGIAADRITAVGHGADEPIVDNATEDGRRKNRRIELRWMPATP